MIAATLLSKALGMVRGMILAWTLGASLEAVAFTAACKIPCAVFDFLFSASILGCFIPTYSKAKEKSAREAYEYSCAFMSAVMLICAVLALFGAVFAPQIIGIVSPKISTEAALLAAKLLRMMFPMMIFTAGAYTLTGILQSTEKFILPAAISSVSNIAIIAYLAFSRDSFSVYALSAVYVFGWFLQFLTLALPLIKIKLMPRPRANFKNEYLLRSAKTAPHIMAGSWLAPASVIIASFFSSFVSDGTFVSYDYASGIYTIIAGVSVYGIGNFVFPSLSKLSAQGNESGFSQNAKNAVFSITIMILPIFAATFSLSYEGIALLYLRDNFTEELARACAGSLKILALSMPVYALSEILYRIFYAAGKVRIPMYATFFAIASSIISNIIFLRADMGLLGISLSYSVSQYVYAIVMYIFGIKLFPDIFRIKDVRKTASLLFGGALCLALMTALEKFLPVFSGINFYIAIFLKISIVFIAGIMIYLIYIFITRTVPFGDMFKKRGENN